MIKPVGLSPATEGVGKSGCGRGMGDITLAKPIVQVEPANWPEPVDTVIGPSCREGTII
ncbi:MAG: hypothetical protein WAX89_06375 [Alphaproteobacteria bacterium]